MYAVYWLIASAVFLLIEAWHDEELDDRKISAGTPFFNADDASIAGYFSLAVKPISVNAANISRTMAEKLARVSILDENTGSYTTAAYLIAQLGKNYSLPREKRIDGSVLLEFALEAIQGLRYSVGGVMEFLECEDNRFLMDFYSRNKFKMFDVRTTTPVHDGEPHQLNQLLKFI